MQCTFFSRFEDGKEGQRERERKRESPFLLFRTKRSSSSNANFRNCPIFFISLRCREEEKLCEDDKKKKCQVVKMFLHKLHFALIVSFLFLMFFLALMLKRLVSLLSSSFFSYRFLILLFFPPRLLVPNFFFREHLHFQEQQQQLQWIWVRRTLSRVMTPHRFNLWPCSF